LKNQTFALDNRVFSRTHATHANGQLCADRDHDCT